jgi:hypothetical protein
MNRNALLAKYKANIGLSSKACSFIQKIINFIFVKCLLG